MKFAEILELKGIRRDIYRLSQSVSIVHGNDMAKEDVEQELKLHLFLEQDKYQVNKGATASTFFRTMLRHKAINMSRIFKASSENANRAHGDYNIENLRTYEGVSFEDNIICKLTLDKLEQRLKSKNKLKVVAVIKLMRKGYTRAECAEKLNTSRPNITRRLAIAKEQVKYVG